MQSSSKHIHCFMHVKCVRTSGLFIFTRQEGKSEVSARTSRLLRGCHLNIGVKEVVSCLRWLAEGVKLRSRDFAPPFGTFAIHRSCMGLPGWLQLAPLAVSSRERRLESHWSMFRTDFETPRNQFEIRPKLGQTAFPSGFRAVRNSWSPRPNEVRNCKTQVPDDTACCIMFDLKQQTI